MASLPLFTWTATTNLEILSMLLRVLPQGWLMGTHMGILDTLLLLTHLSSKPVKLSRPWIGLPPFVTIVISPITSNTAVLTSTATAMLVTTTKAATVESQLDDASARRG